MAKPGEKQSGPGRFNNLSAPVGDYGDVLPGNLIVGTGGLTTDGIVVDGVTAAGAVLFGTVYMVGE